MENDYEYVELMLALSKELNFTDPKHVEQMRELVRKSYDTGHNQGYKLAKNVYVSR